MAVRFPRLGWARPAILSLAALASSSAGFAKVLVTVDQAVKEAFPGAAIEKRTDYLTESQASRIAALAGSPSSSKIVLSYRAHRDGRSQGTAYLETHLVRTMTETILVLVDPAGRVVKVEILAFDEPPEYMPKDRWLAQFEGRPLDPELSLRGAIRGITGATLSSRAIASAVRRVLATHQILSETAPASAPSGPRAAPPPSPPDHLPPPRPAPGSTPDRSAPTPPDPAPPSKDPTSPVPNE